MALRRVLGWVALGVVALGALKIAHSQQPAQGPPSPAASAYLPPAPAPGSVFAAPLGGSQPVRIDIPDVDIHAVLVKVGLQADGSVGAPPLDQAQKAAWYDGSPSPGQAGPSIIDAHVDSRETKGFRGAFYNLGQVQPGEQIHVTRSDHVVATFTVDSVQQAPKSAFPTSRVYGSVPYAALRLITCGGDFDYARGTYKDNTIVYAHMTDTSTN
ncbi:class F sortase [Actinospica sp. MGRD01-02]|uniref:Class F sortase n=1 Tax=Actinospica acidithermotolerans TaxID=2828514 RepID=A0A941EFS6_9ACTN|nr:class F sortase [Actinospica acidithermotolerans]MBR7826894.1 class F sortase [Actinospica acidithermotolerans]